jgi:hypothetical protein
MWSGLLGEMKQRGILSQCGDRERQCPQNKTSMSAHSNNLLLVCSNGREYSIAKLLNRLRWRGVLRMSLYGAGIA